MLSCGVHLAFYVVLLSALEDAVSCPEEWSPHGDYCYQLRGTTSRTSRIWVAARHVCRKKGYLVSIHSRSEQAFVTQLVLNTSNIANMHSVFIGLSSRTSRGGYRWSDGSPVSYTYWKPGFRSKSGKQCVAIETESPGYWTDRNCDDALAYVCKMTMNALVPTQAPPTQANSNVYCKSRWQQYGDRCYKMAPSQAVYSTARQSCIAENAELLSINSVYEQAYILSTLRRKGDIWLGLNDVRTEGEYVWTDGSNVTYV
jgi:C-type mannose receptor